MRTSSLDSPGVKFPPSEASQIAMWLTEVNQPGSFILMRHEYSNCPWLPQKLKSISGGYIGAVYVLGVVTDSLVPNSAADRAIASRIGEIGANWNHTYCAIDFRWMGFKADLQPSTTAYITKICQPTVAKICGDGKKWPALGTDAARVRADLWRNATMAITAGDFMDRFGDATSHEGGVHGELATDISDD